MKHKFIQYATVKTEYWKCRTCGLKLMLNKDGYVIRREFSASPCKGKNK